MYGQEHVTRLALIGRLQRRGYSLAGIKDLLEAWDSGAGLPALLGVEVGTTAIDETPLRLSRAELRARLPGLNTTMLRRAEAVGLVTPDGTGHVIVRSPALLALAADAVNAGLPLKEALRLIGAMRDQLASIADAVADQIVEHIWTRLDDKGRATDAEAILRRGRLLLLQGAASTLADRLGNALLQRADHVPDGAALRSVIGRLRVGAITDIRGNIRYRRPT
jgi:DNA-binding transcriptional MerR regulator